jgi:four helix bundle protein
MSNFKKLDVWSDAHALVLDIYRVTGAFPRAEQFGLTSQIRRAAISIPANLAEGSGRDTQRDFARFTSIALGSADELEYLLILARDLGYLDDDSLSARVQSIARQLVRLRQRAQKNTRSMPKA